MDLVIDANILFAALIRDGLTIDMIFNENIHLFAPEFLIEEFNKHKTEILKKTKRTDKEFNKIYEILEFVITIMPSEEFKDLLNEAKKISLDGDDIQYFALALKLNCPIWSNDKLLKEQNKVKIYSTQEIISLFKNV